MDIRFNAKNKSNIFSTMRIKCYLHSIQNQLIIYVHRRLIIALHINEIVYTKSLKTLTELTYFFPFTN